MTAALWLMSLVGMALVRAPHVRRSLQVKVAASRETRLDRALVAAVTLGLVLPSVWLLTPLLSFADTAGSPLRLAAGAVCFALGLYVLHRAHVDLGTNWSNTLELREGHALVTGGIYRHVRHPMYLALLLHGLGQAFTLPNWVAGPSFLVPFALLLAARLGREERMMHSAFGGAWEAYAARTRRVVPGVW